MYEKKETKNNTGALFNDDKVSIVRKGTIKINNELRYASIIKFETPNSDEPKYELSLSVGLLHVNDADSKKSHKSPDISGSITVDGQSYKFGGWSQISDKGVKYTSVGITQSEKKEESTSESYFPTDEIDIDDDNPF